MLTAFNIPWVEAFASFGHYYLCSLDKIPFWIVSDALTALAYYSISITLFYFAHRRQNLPPVILLLFIAAIATGSTTYLISIWMFWQQTPWQLQGLRAVATLAPIGTAVLLPLLTTEALTSARQSEAVNQALNREIIERRQTEIALQSSETRHRAIVEDQTELICRFLADGTLTFVNPAYCSYFGKPPEELLGQNFMLLLPEEDREIPAKQFGILSPENPVVVYEHRVIASDGNLHWQQWIDRALFDEQDCLIEFQAVGRDITDRKQIELALAESEHRYRQLVELCPDAIFIQCEEKFIFVNQAAVELYGAAEPEALIDRAVIDLVHPDSKEAAQERMRQLIEEQQKVSLREEKWLKLDRTVLDVEVAAIPFLHQETPAAQVFVRDVTKRKRAEIALKNLVTGTASVTGNDFFPVLVRHLALALEVDHAMVSERVGNQFQSLAFWQSQQLAQNLTYPSTHSPCQRVVEQGAYFCLSQVQQQFSENPYLVFLRAESYLGVALLDVSNQPIGVLCIYHSNPLIDSEYREEILRVFAARAAAELERKRAAGALQQLNQQLEARVTERTAELVATNEQLRGEVIERQRAEIALRRSEQRLSLALNAARAGIWEVDIQTNELFWSDTKAILMGYEPSSCVATYENWLRAVHPEDRKQVSQCVRQAIAQGAAIQVEYRVLLPNGTVRWLTCIGEMVPVDQGQPTKVAGISIDITERKQAEAALQERKQHLQSILNNIPDIAWLKDQESRFIAVNERFSQVCGMTPEEVVGKTDYDIWSPELAQRYRNDDLEVISLGHRKQIEEPVVSCEGNLVWIETIKTPIYNDRNEVIGTTGIGRDITQRRQSEAALRTSEERFRSLSACSPVGIFLSDTNGHCSYSNPRWQAITGLSSDQALGDGWAQAIYPEDRERVFLNWSNHVREGREYHDEFRFQTPQGDVHWVYARSSPMTVDGGQLIGYVGTVEDITERKQAEEQLQALMHQLQQQNEQLEEVSRLKSEFLTTMSHELRTPLTSILGFSSVLLQQHFGLLNDKQLQYLSLIHSSGEHLLALINDLLDLAKIEAGKLELNFETANLEDLCRTALEMVEVRAVMKQQQLVLELPVACNALSVDRQRIVQVLLNYLSNAVKFTPEGGTITLKTCIMSASEIEAHRLLPRDTSSSASVRSPASFVVLSVSDTGVGIPLEKQHLLFEKFQQVNGAINRPHEGTGLGLALTKRLVELHGGSVAFTSTSGVGSTFSAWLPLIESEQ